MDIRSKGALILLLLLLFVTTPGVCGKPPAPMRITGATMGTTYSITYFDKKKRDFKKSIDSLLIAVNASINNYDPRAAVSVFNKSMRGIALSSSHLLAPLEKSREVYRGSHGAFDPTVAPLINAWGFGPGKSFVPDSAQVDSLRALTGFDKLILTRDSLLKKDPRVQLDFGGIGQGYGADVMATFLTSKGITDMLVELGGEGMAIGKNLARNAPWQVGVLDPRSTIDNQFYHAYVSLTNWSFTTSGNYFNYYELDGVKYSHTIDPATGFPARRAILSASVFAADCSTADAWATAFMVMGHEQAIAILKQHPDMDALLLYTTAKGEVVRYVTPRLSASITFEPSQQP